MQSIDDMTIKDAREAIERGKELQRLMGLQQHQITSIDTPPDSMLGKYVIVRCRDAGVHAGILESVGGRSCVLRESRRLWYWKAANNQAFLSGVATSGLDATSKIGAPVRIQLTENCEIIECSDVAQASISGAKNYEPQ